MAGSPVKGRYLLVAGILGAMPVVGAPDPGDSQAEDTPSELDPITVTPPYLYDGDRQLGRLRNSLPDMGGDSPASGVIAGLRRFYEQRKDPNNLDPFQQDMLLRALGEREEF